MTIKDATTTITCEAAVIADAVGRANRVAPTKGAAFDKASGVVLEIDPSRPSPVYVKSTDLEVTYLQRIPVSQGNAVGDPTVWRLPSALFTGVLAGLPLGSGEMVELGEKDGSVHIKAGRKRAKLRLIEATSFPKVKPFDPNGMSTVDDLALRISQVAWATDAADPILSGVRLDGTTVTGCDSYVAAIVPCTVPLPETIAVPLRSVAPLLQKAGAVNMRATDTRLELMLDADTQVTSVCLGGAYPDVGRIRRTNFNGSVVIDRMLLADTINKTLAIVRGERYPKLRLTVKENELDLMMQVPEVGRIDDTIDVSGKPDGDEFVIWVDPSRLTEALAAATQQIVTFNFGPKPTLPMQVLDANGFDCWIMPIDMKDVAWKT